MNTRLDTLLSVIMTAAALAVAGVVIRGHFGPSRTADRPVPDPIFIEEWTALKHDGVALGPSTRAVQLLEFADLECPFCADFHRNVLQPVLARHGDAIAFTFIHYPLRMHRFAHRAAVAAECADGQGRFEQYINAVYEKQDSLGLKSWWSYAQAASVPDSVAFESCINGPPSGRIAAGLEWADRLSLTGTPTVIVNGWRLPRAPSANELDDIVRAVQAGRDPFVRPEVDDD